MPTRNRIPHKWKPALLERDGYACVYCGETNPDKLEIDHLIPRQRGGPDRMWNLAIVCALCNGRKGTNLVPPAIEKLTRNVDDLVRRAKGCLDGLA